MNTVTQALPCPLWRRLLALVYDLLAVVAIIMVVGLLCQMVTGGQLFDAHGKPQTWWFQPVEYVVVSAYFIASWLRGGQTLGMRPWRIRVTRMDGSKLSLRQGLIRLIVAALPLLLLEFHPWIGLRGALWAVGIAWGVWFAFGLIDRRRRALHDVAAGTEIRLI